MKKKIGILIFFMVLVALTISGCKSGETESRNNEVEHESTKKLAESDRDKAAVAEFYEYVQELNIIEDNYRNFYEIFVYSFYDSDSDGIGDINGIISKLDYINDGKEDTDTDLGFNGIWLMPIMSSTTYHKYDVIDYYAIDPEYGTLEDFQNLIKACDERNIKLIIDLVFNHTSAKHPWFQEAVAYLEGLEEGEEPDLTECPYVGYYHFMKDYNGGAAYHKAGRSDWYYEGVFWDQMPDLALDNEAVRAEIEQVAKYWLDMGVDGFRLDAAKEFYSGEKERNVEVLKWFTDYVASIDQEAYIVAEVWDGRDTIAAYYESGITSLFNFPLSQHDGKIIKTVRQSGDSSALSFAQTIVSLQKQYRQKNPEFIDAPFISNHDNTRVSAQCMNDEDQMKMAAGLLLTMNGSPFVYYGEEIGMNSLGSKDENKRLPMQWSITDPKGMAKGPLAADKVIQKFTPVEEQLQNPLSILNYYKRAIRIRNENPELARGEVSSVKALSGKEICALQKIYKGSEIMIVYNINTEAASVSLKEAGYEELNIRGYLTVDGSVVTLTDGILEMPKYAIAVLK